MASQIDTTVPEFGTPTTQSVRDNFTTAANEITTLQNATAGSPFLSLQGGRMAGPMYLFNDPTDAMMPATKGYVDAGGGGGGGGIPEAPSVAGQVFGRSEGAWLNVLALAGGIMNGPLTLHADPENALDAATKEYVDGVAETVIPDAPSDAFFYGRHANAWAHVLALTGGQLSGALGVGQTLPANINVGAIVAGTTASVARGINTYQDTTGAWHYLTNGPGGAITNGSNGIGFYMAPSGTAGAAATWGAAVQFDYKGNVILGLAPAIPTDATNPTISAMEYAAGVNGHYSTNSYIATGPTWKYLNAGYAATFFLNNSTGALNILTAPSGSAGANIAFNPAFTFDQSGGLTVPGGIGSGGGYNCGGSINIPASQRVNLGAGVYLNADSAGNSGFNTPNVMNLVGTSGIYVQSAGIISFMAANQWVFDILNGGTLGPINDNLTSNGYGGHAWFQVYSYNFPNASDPRLKEEMSPSPAGALNIVRATPVYNYRFNTDKTRKLHTGFDATEVRNHLPHAVMELDDEDKTLAINSPDMLALLWQAVQELAEFSGYRDEPHR